MNKAAKEAVENLAIVVQIAIIVLISYGIIYFLFGNVSGDQSLSLIISLAFVYIIELKIKVNKLEKRFEKHKELHPSNE